MTLTSHNYKGRTIHPCAYAESLRWYLEVRQGDLVWDERNSPQFRTLRAAYEHIDEQVAMESASDPVIDDALAFFAPTA